MAYKKVQGIYRIINRKTGYCYIGSSSDIHARFNRHKNELCMNIHHNLNLQKDYNMHGKTEFDYEVVLIVKDKSKLVLFEHKLINATDHTYNIGMENNDNLTKHPNKKQIIKKISKGLLKINSEMTDEERKEKWARYGANNPNWKGGKIFCPICNRVLISSHNKFGCEHCYRKNRKGSDNPFYGKNHNKETREKISKSRIGKIPVNSIKVKIGNTVYDSNTQAAKAVGCSVATIGNRCKNDKFHEYSFITDHLERPSKSQALVPGRK